MTAPDVIDDVLAVLKGAAAVARALGVGDGAIHSAVLRPEEAAVVDAEVDLLEEAKLEAVRARGNKP